MVDGDFNDDGQWDCDDINALTRAIAGGSIDLAFDMNGDHAVSLADVRDAGVGWLAVGGAHNPAVTGGNPFLQGDANLDGVVDVSDFNLWNMHKFTTADEWCQGDFNASGNVDVSDFNVWNSNKFRSSVPPLSAAPPLADQRLASAAVPLRAAAESKSDLGYREAAALKDQCPVLTARHVDAVWARYARDSSGRSRLPVGSPEEGTPESAVHPAGLVPNWEIRFSPLAR